MIRVTFFMEQGKGYRTYYRNLRPFMDAHPDITATWVPITYWRKDSLLNRLPILPGAVRGLFMRAPRCWKASNAAPAMWLSSTRMCPRCWAAR